MTHEEKWKTRDELFQVSGCMKMKKGLLRGSIRFSLSSNARSSDSTSINNLFTEMSLALFLVINALSEDQ